MYKRIIEEILKPYIDKKDELDRTLNEFKERKENIEKEQDKLYRKKNNEIDSYINDALSKSYSIDKNSETKKVNNYLVQEIKLKNELEKLNEEINSSKIKLKEELKTIIVSVKTKLLDKQQDIIKELEQKRLDLYETRGLMNFDDKSLTIDDEKLRISTKQKLVKEVNNLKEVLEIIDRYLSEFEEV